MVKQLETKIHQNNIKRKARERNLEPPPKMINEQTKNSRKKKEKESEKKNKQHNN